MVSFFKSYNYIIGPSACTRKGSLIFWKDFLCLRFGGGGGGGGLFKGGGKEVYSIAINKQLHKKRT